MEDKKGRFVEMMKDMGNKILKNKIIRRLKNKNGTKNK